MITALARRLAARLARADPYAPRPEPLATIPELTVRVMRMRADVLDSIAADDVNRWRTR